MKTNVWIHMWWYDHALKWNHIEEFKDKIYNNYQLQLKKQEIYNILSTFIRCFTELIYNLKEK